MSTDAAATHTSKLTDLEILYRWVGKQIASGHGDMPLDEALERFRGYFEDLQGVRAEIAVALEQSERGEVDEWDLERFKADMRRRWAEKGLVD